MLTLLQIKDRRTVDASLLTDDAAELRALLAPLVGHWDGKACIEQMKRADFQWRQMEWQGFYGEMRARDTLAGSRFTVGETYGRVTFDFKGHINWDVKVHCNHSPASPLNDVLAVDESIARHGTHGLIIIEGECTLDHTGAFKAWHDALKGGVSDYEVERIARGAPSRARKTAVEITRIAMVPLNRENIGRLGRFQRGMRNADGSLRNEKYQISRELIADYMIE